MWISCVLLSLRAEEAMGDHSRKEAMVLRLRRLILGVCVAVAGAIMVYLTLPVYVMTGVVTFCGDPRHGDSDPQISSTVHTERVPRWQARRYTVTEVEAICPSCQAKIDEEARLAKLEAERQERIAREAAEREAHIAETRAALDGQILLGNRSEISVREGDKFHFALTISNRGNQPLSFKVKVESGGHLELAEQKPVENPFSPLGNEILRRYWEQWPKLIGGGLDVGESISGTMERRNALNPGYSDYYAPESFVWPYYQHYVEFGTGVDVVMADVDAGRDYGIQLYAVYEEQQILLAAATVHVMHP